MTEIAGGDVEYWEAGFIAVQGYARTLEDRIKILEERNEILSGRIYALIAMLLITWALVVVTL